MFDVGFGICRHMCASVCVCVKVCASRAAQVTFVCVCVRVVVVVVAVGVRANSRAIQVISCDEFVSLLIGTHMLQVRFCWQEQLISILREPTVSSPRPAIRPVEAHLFSGTLNLAMLSHNCYC